MLGFIWRKDRDRQQVLVNTVMDLLEEHLLASQQRTLRFVVTQNPIVRVLDVSVGCAHVSSLLLYMSVKLCTALTY